MFDKDKPIAEQSCRPAFPGVNLTIAVNGSIIPQPGSKPLPQYSPEAWETQVHPLIPHLPFSPPSHGYLPF